jgi:hypothetical protein
MPCIEKRANDFQNKPSAEAQAHISNPNWSPFSRVLACMSASAGEIGRTPAHSHAVSLNDLGHTHVGIVNDLEHARHSIRWEE